MMNLAAIDHLLILNNPCVTSVVWPQRNIATSTKSATVGALGQGGYSCTYYTTLLHISTLY